MATSSLLKPNIKLNSLTNGYRIGQLFPNKPLPKSSSFPRLIIHPRLTLKCSVTSKNSVSELAKSELKRNPCEIVANAILKPLQEPHFAAILFLIAGLLCAPPPALALVSSGGCVGANHVNYRLLLSALCAYILDDSLARSSLIKLQVGFFGPVRSLQKDLNRIAKIDTSEEDNMTLMLTETTLSLLRHVDYCVSGYSSVEVKPLKNIAPDEQFKGLSVEERGKFDEETLVNWNNVKKQSTSSKESTRTTSNNERIVVTVLVLCDKERKFPTISSIKDVKEALKMLGSYCANDTWAVEVLWTPQRENDLLTKREVLDNYPLLQHFK